MGSSYLAVQYQWGPVLLSYLMAAYAAYGALDFTHRLYDSPARQWRWLCLGALAMGIGIWSMHFIGMQAAQLPIPVGYDFLLTATSLLLAIGVALLALWVGSRDRLGLTAVGFGAILMGSGIAAMHYTGMAAMRMHPAIDYDPLLYAASILIAMGASGAALWILFNLRSLSPQRRRLPRLLAAAVMGLAISGMHYTGMAAARFPGDTVCAASDSLSGRWLVAAIAAFSLGMGLLMTRLVRQDARRQAARSASRQHLNQERRARFEAYFDPLTKLPNRGSFQREVDKAILRAKHRLGRFDLYYCALNHDSTAPTDRRQATMQLVAERLRETCGEGDVLARYGEQDFVLLHWQDDEPPGPEALCSKIRRACMLALNAEPRAQVWQVQLGFAGYPQDGETLTALLSAATRRAQTVSSLRERDFGAPIR